MTRIAINIKAAKIEPAQSSIIVGIDLGTTNSLVAFIKDGVPLAVKDPNNKATLVPSVVYFQPDGKVVVGDEAKQKLETAPQRTIYSVKRLMGKSFNDLGHLKHWFGYQVIDDDTESLVKIRVGDRFYSPTELSAEILKSLRARVEANLGQPVSRAVITVPAYFNDAQRQATRDAGRLAGLDVLRIINEPTAAALAYGLGKKETETVAVYDLGGGTFDISILQIQDGIFEVLSTNGDTFLGGDDFDRAIVDYWVDSYLLDPQTVAADKSFAQSLRLLAESAKKALSVADAYEGDIQGKTFAITKPVFEGLIGPMVQKTVQCCQKALADAKLPVDKIDHVIMVGGSTRVPLVKQQIAGFFKQPVFDKLDPDEVVALGAAIQADVLAGNQKDVLLLDITPLSLGIETVGGLMDVIIARNTTVPVRAGRQYTTSVDGQRNLKIAIFQGERDLVEHNRKLGEFVLRGIPPMPAGLPKIEIHFIINADGILKVKAKELRSGTEQAIEVKPTYGISEEEMAQMLVDSIKNAATDMNTRALQEAKNEAQHILLAAEKFLAQNQGIFSEAEVAATQRLVADLQMAHAGADKDAINVAIQQLNQFTAPLAHRAMDKNIAEAMRGQQV